ncbi:MAG: cytochrome c biogenesis CcdA family protein [Thermoplasmata archaeon]
MSYSKGGSKKGEKPVSADNLGEWIECPECGANVKTKNILEHLKKVHGLHSHEKLKSVEVRLRAEERKSGSKARGKSAGHGMGKKNIIVVSIVSLLLIAAIGAYLAYTSIQSSKINNSTNSQPQENGDWLSGYTPQYVIGSGNYNWWNTYPAINPNSGKTVSHPDWVRQDLMRNPVLIVVHSTGCPPCGKQIEICESLHAEYSQLNYHDICVDYGSGTYDQGVEAFNVYDPDDKQSYIPLTIIVSQMRDRSGALITIWHSWEGLTGSDVIEGWIKDAIYYFINSKSLAMNSVPHQFYSQSNERERIPLFTAVDVWGNNFSLENCTGKVVIIHITSIENPICIECEKEMKAQIVELQKLIESQGEGVCIITINIRKNPASEAGWKIVENWYGVNITWYWFEEFEPYPVASHYLKYWSIDGAFSNPTLVLTDMELRVVWVYHVYCIGKGEIDGVQSADSLAASIRKIQTGEWTQSQNIPNYEITFFGIFLLGLITAFTPCSIALLVAMLSYGGAVGGKKEGKRNPRREMLEGFWIGVAFTIGMALIFFVFGCFLSLIGFFTGSSAIFYLIAGIILIILGSNILLSLGEKFKSMFLRIGKDRLELKTFREGGKNLFIKTTKRSVYMGAFLLGILFSVGWAPCAISLVFPVFILLLTQQLTMLMSGFLLFVFGIAHGIPVILLLAVSRGTRAALGNRYISAGKWIEKGFGIALICIGVLFSLKVFGVNLW